LPVLRESEEVFCRHQRLAGRCYRVEGPARRFRLCAGGQHPFPTAHGQGRVAQGRQRAF
jgi:hypothetical protein